MPQTPTFRIEPTDLAVSASDEPVFRELSELLDDPQLLAPPKYAIPRIAILGRLTILAAPDKCGKSTMMAHAAAGLSFGRPFLGESCSDRYSRTVWVGLEEATQDAVRRFKDLNGHPNRLRLVVRPVAYLLESTRDLLADWPADLVVVDSLQEYARVTRGVVPDSGDDAGWASVVRPLVALARDLDVAVVVLHHVRKSDGQYRGSTEIAAAADALLEMSPPKAHEDARVRHIKGRGRWQIEPFSILLDGDTYEVVGGVELSLDRRVLLHVKANPGASKTATRKAVTGRALSIDAALERLLERGDIREEGGRYYPPSDQNELAVQG